MLYSFLIININSKLIEELPSMEQIFSEVKKNGENAIQILEYQRRNLFYINLKSKCNLLI